ncbi:Tail-specific protease precursor [Anaerobiospirillum thomasii]|uniref:carboxy terminal-processing peptidase n=1 Tax=Anaerobiospirillum thomasii TaxID=179995 RepID=UPI000D87DD06|nr:carboxy terminal-processing peptidase [Anaerobiospirillum thomasii]SPT67977.1 Tail-specific protease precursor [Anaerobiospirillum thomasii]
MFKLNKLALLVPLCLCFGVQAKLNVPQSIDELPVLAQDNLHSVVCSRTANYFLRAHYKAVKLDNAFADNVIAQYLSYLDYNKSLYLQSEVDEIYNNRAEILKAIELCNLTYPYALYNENIKKRFKKYSFYLEKLKSGFDVDTDGVIEMDRSESAYFTSRQQLEDQWLKELKNEYINQILQGKSDEKAKERLKKRFESALSRLVQVETEDVFSTFENAFATAIDPHTSYLSKQASENFNDDINLSLEGIGAVLMADDEFTVINSLVAGSPAELSKKLKPKDKIVGVRQEDGTYDDIIGWRLNDVVKKIKGPKGSAVYLDIERDEGSTQKNFTVKLIRDKIKLQDRAAKGEVKLAGKDKVGVLSIKSFYTDLHKDIKKELEKLKKENISSLVIDLRSNGGGLLPEATSSTGLFIKDGPIVLVRDVVGNIMPQVDTDESVAYDGPIVVLINRLSASSSEIMAAALRDYGRAVIIGDTSFGKGTVQQNKHLARVYDYANEDYGSVHYTIAKFYRINGNSTQLKGVVPDITFPGLVDNTQVGERVEKNALNWDKIDSVDYQGYLNIDAYVPELTLRHNNRVKDNLAFRIMREDMDRYLALKEKKVLSVNLDKRRQMKDLEDKIALENTNSRLKEMGKDPVKKVDDLPDDFEFPDALLNEAVNIASDFATLSSSKVHSAQNTPIFTMYSVSNKQDNSIESTN